VANVYSTRFIQGIIAGTALFYNVPAGFVAVVRDIECMNFGTYTEGLQLVWVTGPSTTNIFQVAQPLARVGPVYSWDGRVVLQAGEQIKAQALDSNWHVRVDGFLLSIP
jgi:hypothetical protein